MTGWIWLKIGGDSLEGCESNLHWSKLKTKSGNTGVGGGGGGGGGWKEKKYISYKESMEKKRKR